MRWMWGLIFGCLSLYAAGQKRWDGGAGTDAWMDEQNWHPNGIPTASDTILLDHAWVMGSYTVKLPEGMAKAEGYSLSIQPGTNRVITVELPSTSTAVPGLQLYDPQDGLLIDSGGIFINASGASSGNPLLLAGKLRINNGGRYIHRTGRGNADLTNRLSAASGTEKGIFMFDVPGTAGYTVSLTGKTFGTLVFSAAASGSQKSYQAGGSSNLVVQGDLIIETGARVSSSLTADIRLKGDLITDGHLILSPATMGNTGRSLIFEGPLSGWWGTGKVEAGPWFRKFHIEQQTKMELDFAVRLPLTTHQFCVAGHLHLKSLASIAGSGSFDLLDLATIQLASENGLCKNCPLSPIRTDSVRLSSAAFYRFSGTALQHSGMDLPDTVRQLQVDNIYGLSLEKSLYLMDSLVLINGSIRMDTVHFISVQPSKIYLPTPNPNSWIIGRIRTRLPDTVRNLIPVGSATRYAPMLLKRISSVATETDVYFVDAPPEDPNQWAYWQLQPPDTSIQLEAGYILPESSQLSGYLPLTLWEKRSTDWLMIPAQKKEWQTWQYLEAQQPLDGPVQQTIQQTQAIFLHSDILTLQGQIIRGEAVIQLPANLSASVLLLKSYNGIDFYIRDSIAVRGPAIWKEKIAHPITYYQLMQTDYSEKRYGNILRLKTSDMLDWKVYPNPASSKIFIFSADPCSTRRIEIVNISGRVMRDVVTGSEELDISDLSKGTYVLRITGCSRRTLLHITKI